MAYVKKYALVRVEKTCLNTICEIRIVKTLHQDDHKLYITGTAMFNPGLVCYHLITLEKGYFEAIHLHLLNNLLINSN